MTNPAAYSTPKNNYWKANLSITFKLLLVWFFASFGCGILFKEYLDQFSIGGAPLGFWMAQQGSILVFVVLILAYMRLMDRLDAQYANDNAAENSAHSDEEAGQ